MANERIIFSKWLAYQLRKQGFRLIRTDINRNYPQFDVWVFEDCKDLQIAINCLTRNKHKH